MNPFNRGQVLVVALMVMVLVMMSLPYLIRMIQSESKWTMKQQKATRAFHLAEIAVEQGHSQLLSSTSSWANVLMGNPPSGYDFDTTYTNEAGGSYEIRMAPLSTTEAYVYGVGRDSATGEVRGIRATFTRSGAIGAVLQASGLIDVSGLTSSMEWGPIISYTGLSTGGKNYPRYYSTGSILPQDLTLALPPNTDGVQWWSYKSDLPTAPVIDFTYYQNLAQNAGAAPPAGCPASYYVAGNATFTDCQDTSGRTYYITGNATMQKALIGGTGNYIVGNVIVLGTLNFAGVLAGNVGKGNYSTAVPPYAWREYGNAWAYYRSTFDAGAPASYAAAVASNYASAATVALTHIIVHGFVYTGGGLSLGALMSGKFHGVAVNNGAVSLSLSTLTVYYDPVIESAVQTTNMSVTRSGWEETRCSWTGAHASCP